MTVSHFVLIYKLVNLDSPISSLKYKQDNSEHAVAVTIDYLWITQCSWLKTIQYSIKLPINCVTLVKERQNGAKCIEPIARNYLTLPFSLLLSLFFRAQESIIFSSHHSLLYHTLYEEPYSCSHFSLSSY